MLPQHRSRSARPLLRGRQSASEAPPGHAPGRTRTCDPLLRRREHLLRSTAACRSGRSTSDGPHIAAAVYCGLPLPQRFHVDPPAFTPSDSEVSELAAHLLFVLSGRVSADRRPSDSTRPQETGQSASHSDDDLSLGVSLSLVLESHGDLTQLVAAIDDGRERSGLDELLQRNQVLPVVPHDKHAHLLAHER
jgi:hypothetical protein